MIKQGEVYYYHLDQLNTPRFVTNNKAEVVWENQADVYGYEEPEAESNFNKESSFTQPIRFQGQYLDEESGLHYNRYRYYSPKQQRFINQDPIGLVGGINHYQYAPNPVNWVDPFGLSCKENGWNTFQKNSKGVFSNVSQASIGYKLWKEQKWLELQDLLGPEAWPPNRGFVSIEKVEVNNGSTIDRFGGFIDPNGEFRDFGTFVSPEGNSFASRALPPSTREKDYNAYEVLEPLEVNAGAAIPWFGQPGGGIQYELPTSIENLKSKNKIKKKRPINNKENL
nr:RHS repeat-associated core domain-containing protein [Pseudoalteromonas sp. MMG006]